MSNVYLLEPLLSHLRMQRVSRYISNNSTVCDIGCGVEARLLTMLKSRIKKGFGIDELINPEKEGNLIFKRVDIETHALPILKNSVDYVTLLAVLEHVKDPRKLLAECYRILKFGGSILITTPTQKSEPVLNLLAKLKLVSPEMIDQHENYFSASSIQPLLKESCFHTIKSQTFEFGFNLFARATK